MEDIKFIFEIIQYGTVSLASVAAIIGINKWREEIEYKKYTDLAEETIELLYRVKDSIRNIRNPFSYDGEGESRKKSDTETSQEKEIRNRAYIIIERMEKYSDLFIKLDSAKYKFMAIFDKEAEKIFIEINKIIHTIRYSSYRLSDLWERQNHISSLSEEKRKEHLDEMHKWERIFWEIEENDDINNQIDKAINDLRIKYLDSMLNGKKPLIKIRKI